MAKTNNLVSTYVAYKQKREEIKARQRIELERELEPFLIQFGKSVMTEQAIGKKITDIEYQIGAKNRTLIYEAKRLAKGFKKDPEPEPDRIEPERNWKVDGPYRELGTDARYWDVSIGEAYKGSIWKFDQDHEITMPDEWAADFNNQDVYREIVAHIKGL